MNILFIAPSVFNFYRHIISSFEERGHNVKYIDEYYRTGVPLIDRLILKLPDNILIKMHELYISKNINEVDEVDKIVIIRGRYFSESLLRKIKIKYPNKPLIMYQWDFCENLPLLDRQIKYFDEIYSFDRNDCDKYGFTHKPLFFNKTHKNISDVENKIQYDISFIGTDHSNRYEMIQDFISKNDTIKKKYIYLYRPYLSLCLNFFFDYKNFKKRNFKFYKKNHLDEESVIDVISKSRAILDIAQPNQDGLTIRTLEALGLKKKLVTTNKNIINYDFYNTDNILIIDSLNMTVPEYFFLSEYKEIPEAIYNKYFIDNWIEEFL